MSLTQVLAAQGKEREAAPASAAPDVPGHTDKLLPDDPDWLVQAPMAHGRVRLRRMASMHLCLCCVSDRHRCLDLCPCCSSAGDAVRGLPLGCIAAMMWLLQYNLKEGHSTHCARALHAGRW